MKKSTRLTSVLLAFLLVLSCCAAGFSAFAMENEETTAAVESSTDEAAANTEEVTVDPEVAVAVEEYKNLTAIKDSLTPEQQEALKKAEKAIVEFGLDCTDKLTSPEAVAAYNQLFSSVADTAGEVLADVDLAESIGTIKTMVSDLAAEVEETAAERFIRIVNSVEEPYDNADIAMVKAAYELLPDNASIPAEVMQKYRAILACIGPDIASTEMPDLSGFEKTVVTYPTGVTKAQVEQAIPKLDELIDTILPLLGIEGLDNGLNDFIQNDFYTNNTVGALLKALSALGELLFGDKAGYAATVLDCYIMVYPETYYLGETEDGDILLKGAAEKLYNFMLIEDPETLEEAWNALTFENGDFGFEDGDKEGFKDALASLFLPYGTTISMLGLQMTNVVDTENGTYTYGGYEGLIPIFEMLDLKDVMSSHDFTLFVEDRTSPENDPSGLRELESWVRVLLDPICNLIDDLGAAPVATVLDLLPKLAYMLKTDMLDTQLFTAIKMMGIERDYVDGLIAGLAPDMFPNGLQLTTEGLFDLVAPLLQNITVKEAVVDPETGAETTPATTISITLDKEKFIQFINDLGGCGDAAAKDSVARGTAYRLGINSDKADALLVLFRWLYGELTTDENIDAFKTAVDAADMDSTVKSLLKVVLSAVAALPANTAFTLIINLLAPTTPDIDSILPNIPGLPNIDLPGIGGDSSLGGIMDTVSGLFGGLFGGDSDSGSEGGTAQTGNPSIPQTGGKAVMSLFAIAVTAAAVIGAVSLKKKEDNE